MEINSSFYKTPLYATYQKWSLDVPDDFRFSIKLTREVTHAKALEGNLDLIDKFLRSAIGAGEKKGCLLIQFPGSITLDYFSKVEEILDELRFHDPDRQWKKAVEFRDPSWYAGETFEMLEQHGAAMVLHDIPKSRNFDSFGTAGFVYIRFHGPKGDYRDSYSEIFLETKAHEILKWSDEGRDVYVYFNNTIGNAFENARSLKEKCGV